MTWSLGETQSLAQKACVGAGYRWGQAEDAGRAVRFLCRYGFDGPAALAALLTDLDGRSGPSASCPISLGTRIVDGDLTIGATAQEFEDVLSPELLIPFVAWGAAARAQWLLLTVPGHVVTACPHGQIRADEGPSGPVTLRMTEARADGTLAPSVTRADVQPRTRATLNRFAGRTFAPATEESRAKGAG